MGVDAGAEPAGEPSWEGGQGINRAAHHSNADGQFIRYGW